MHPEKITFPTYDAVAWSKGDRRSAGEGISIDKYTSQVGWWDEKTCSFEEVFEFYEVLGKNRHHHHIQNQVCICFIFFCGG